MKCIVCNNDIRIDSLKQLFALQPILLCNNCSKNLIPKSIEVLYEDNEWIRTVIDKLNRGDIVLTKILKNRLQKTLLKKRATKSKIKIIEADENLPYPWLEILLDSIELNSKEEDSESIIVTVYKQKNANHQVAIIS